MASGIISMYSEHGQFEGKLEWATYTNAASNSSTITITASVIKRMTPPAAGIWYHDLIISTEDNSEVLARSRMDGSYAVVGYTDFVEIFTFTETIPHKADGSRKINICCDVWLEDDEIDYDGVSTSYIQIVNSDGYAQIIPHPNNGEYLVSLDSIIRKAVMKSAPDIDDKTTSIKIEYSNPMGSYVSSVEVCIANSTGNTIIVPYRAVNKTGTSYTFNLSSTERQALVNAMGAGSTMGIRYYIRTIAYETYHYDFISKTYTMSDAMPTISAGAADMNDTTIALTGDSSKFIRYHSTAAVSINAVAKQGATIVKTYVENGSFNSDENLNGIYRIPNVDSGTFKVSATDSRGNTVSQTLTKTLIPYVKVSCRFGVSMELVSNTNAKATLHIRGNYFNNTFGKVFNTIKLEYCRTDDSGAWGSWITIDVPTSAMANDTYSIDQEISGLNYKKQYKFMCRVSDKLNTITTDSYVSGLQPIFDWSATDFNFNVPVKFQSEYAMNDYIVDYGTEAMGTNGTWYWFKYKSGRSECYGLRNFGNMGVSTAFGALYRSSSFTQDLPQDVFMINVVPDYISINVVANGTGWVCRNGSGSSPAYYTTGSFYVVSPTSGNQSAVWLSFHVKGRWK